MFPFLCSGGASTPAQITVYPDPANGNPRFAYGTNTSWAACRSQATSDPVEYPTNSVVFQGEQAGATYIISRNGYVYDISSIPSSAIITGGVFSVYSTGSGDSSETTNPSNGSLVAYTPSSDTAPTTSDYQSFGTTKLCDTDVTRTTFLGSSGYKDWTLNASGIAVLQAALAGTGRARLGIRPSNDFSDATAPVARSYASGDFAAQTGTSQDPKLVIDYLF
jgi:predicted heme/steroid binding protein